MAKKGIYVKCECVKTQEKYYPFEFYKENTLSVGFGYTAYVDFSIDQTNGYINMITPTDRIDGNGRYRKHNDTTFYEVSIYEATSTQWKCYQTWYRVTSSTRDVYSKGVYLSDVIADYGSLPADGRHSDGYWYTFTKMASDLKVNYNGVWKDTPEGWVNVNGIWKLQSELKANVNGIYR